jgi:hypothetical protein
VDKKITHIISARLTQALQQTIVDQCKWQQVEPGLEVGEVSYQPHGWSNPQRLVVVTAPEMAFIGASGREDLNWVRHLQKLNARTWPSAWLRERGQFDAARLWDNY